MGRKQILSQMSMSKKIPLQAFRVEGFWSLLKRGIKGNFHFVTKKYLESYVTEFEYRYNNRENELVFGDVLNRMLGV